MRVKIVLIIAALFTQMAQAEKHKIQLGWAPVNGALKYQVEVRRGGRIVQKSDTQANQLEVSVDAGKYRYRIRSFDALGRAGKWSRPQPLNVVPTSPLLGETGKVFESRNRVQNVTFKWKGSREFDDYQLKVYKDGKLEKTRRTSAQQITLPLSSGNYEYSVLGSKDRLNSEESKRGQISVHHLEQPDSVKIIVPKRRQRVLDNSVHFKWTEQKGASEYELKVYRIEKRKKGQPRETKLVLEKKVSASSVTENLPDGRYRVQVRAIDQLGKGKKSKGHTFKVDPPGPYYRTNLSVALGMTTLTYTETSEPDYSSLNVTGKVNLSFRFARDWDVAANTFFNILPLSASRVETIRFLGVNGRLGYRLPFIKRPFRFKLMVGGYFITTFTVGDGFGFKNMMGPQVFPVISYRFSKHSSSYVYGKYSPIMEGFSVPTFKSRELAVGGGFIKTTRSGFAWMAAIDFASLDINFSDKLFIVSESITGSFGIGF